jgi:hypothetical protein
MDYLDLVELIVPLASLPPATLGLLVPEVVEDLTEIRLSRRRLDYLCPRFSHEEFC